MKYLLLALAAWPALAQNISIGVRGGIPLNNALSAAQSGTFSFSSQRPSYAVGPTFEVRLPFGLGFHVDALYRKIGVTGSGPVAGANAATVSSATNSFSFWQFPVMLKWRAGVGPIRPFVNGGPSFSKLSGIGDASSCLISLGAGNCTGKVLKSSGTGVAFGGGLDIKVPVIRLSPEIRYTRLGANFFQGGAGATLASQRNQLEFLVGVTF